MRYLTLIIASLLMANVASAKGKEKVVYKYKKFEVINLDEIKVDGELGGPGEISISQRYLKKFKNKLPSKPNFNLEMMKGLERIR
jgi:hypothetical protein